MTSPRIEPLEPRVLFSADIPGLGDLAASDDNTADLPTELPTVTATADDPAAVEDLLAELPTEQAIQPRSEVVFVDTSVNAYQTLIAEILNRGDPTREITVYTIQPDESITEISLTLATHSNLDAIHFVTHGTDASVRLGSSTLSSSTMPDFSADLSAWGTALNVDGDILLYGCNVASSASGQDFIAQLATATQADIAASTDPTGHHALGGDWALEFEHGPIAFEAAVLSNDVDSWESLLQSITVTTKSDDVDATDLSSVTALLATDGNGDLINAGPDQVISLREAIIAANAEPDADVIYLADDKYEVNLTGGGSDEYIGDLNITNPLTIIGDSNPGTADGTTIDGKNQSRQFSIVDAGEVTLSNLHFHNGIETGDGGAIYTNNTLLTMDNVTAHNNEAGRGGVLYAGLNSNVNLHDVSFYNNIATANGGAIYVEQDASNYSNNAIVHIYDSAFSANAAKDGGTKGPGGAIYNGGGTHAYRTTFDNNSGSDGGAIYNLGELRTHDTTFKNNDADNSGGALFTTGPAYLNRTLISTNTATTGAGAYNQDYLEISDSTLAKNVASGNGGAIMANGSTTTLIRSTVVDNEAATHSAMEINSSTVNYTGSLFSRNNNTSSDPDIGGTGSAFNSQGFNLTTTSLQGSIATDIVIPGGDAKLAANLASNGGIVESYALVADSPAVNAGAAIDNNSATTIVDSTGVPRNTVADIGSFELRQSTETPLLYWTDRATNAIYRSDPINDTTQKLLDTNQLPIDIEVSLETGRIYWVETDAPGTPDGSWGTLNSANLDGTDKTELQNALQYPMGLAVDAASNRIYVTSDLTANNSGGVNAINAYQLDGSFVEAVVTDGDGVAFSAPTDVEIDPDTGLLLWTDRGQNDADGTALSRAVHTIDSAGVINTSFSLPSSSTTIIPYGASFAADTTEFYWAGSNKIDLSNTTTGSANNTRAITTNYSLDYYATTDTVYAIQTLATNSSKIISLSGDLATETTLHQSLPAPAGIVAAGIESVGTGPALTINTGITLNDSESTTIVSGNLYAIDADSTPTEIVFTLSNPLPVYGTLLLDGMPLATSGDTFTLDDVIANRLSYQNNGTSGSDSFAFTVMSSLDTSDVTDIKTFAFTVLSVNDEPVLSGIEPATLLYSENAGPVELSNTVTVSDTDDSNLESATVIISNNYNATEDLLDYTDTANISSTWDPVAGMLTLTGTDSIAAYQTALRSVVYENNSENPDTSARTISITIEDGDEKSKEVTRVIAPGAVNDKPVFTAFEASTLTFTEGDSAVTITTGADLLDADHINLASATVVISSNYAAGEDLINFTNTANISGNWNNTTGTLVLSGGDSVANYQAALRSLTYSNSSDAPNEAIRTITFTASDGIDDSDPVARSISVSAKNDAPQLDNSGTMTLSAISEDDLDPTGNTVAQIVASATGDRITDVDDGAVEGIAIINADNSYGIWQYKTTPLSLWTGIGLVSNSSALLLNSDSSVRFLPSINYNGTSGNIEFRAQDQTGADSAGNYVDTSSNGGTSPFSITTETANISITPQNDAPVLSAIETANLSYTEDDGAVTVSSTIAATDPDDTLIESATITIISGYDASQDVLGVIDVAPVVSTWDSLTGTLTLTGQDTIANYQSLLRSVTYENTSQKPDPTERTLSFSINDGDADSTPVNRGISVNPLNDAPTFDNSGTLTLDTIIEDAVNPAGNSIQQILQSDGGDRITDVDDNAVEGIAITSADNSNGTWQYKESVSDSWIDLAPVSLSNALLLHDTSYLRFIPAADYHGTSGPIGFKAYDRTSGTLGSYVDTVPDGGTSAFSTNRDNASLTIDAGNDPAVITALEGTAIAYTENDGQQQLSTLLTLTDVDNTTLESATISIASGYLAAEDILQFTDTTTIGSTWNSATGTLTLTGTDSLSAYQTAIRSVTYENTSDNPDTTDRRFSIVVYDGGTDSAAVLRSIEITPQNDLPELSSLEGSAVLFDENDPATGITSTITLNDVDNNSIQSARVIISNGYETGADKLLFTDTANIVGNWNSATGTLTLSGADSLSSYQQALRSVTFHNPTDNPSAADRTLSFSVNDGAGNSAIQTRTIDFTVVNDALMLSGIEVAPLNFTEDTTAVVTTSTITLSDADDTHISLATVGISSGYIAGDDHLYFTDTASITGAWNAGTGVLTLSGADTVLSYQDALRSIRYENTSDAANVNPRTLSYHTDDGKDSTASITRALTVTRVNDAPVIADASLAPIDEDTPTPTGATVASLFTTLFADPDAGSYLAGIAITGNTEDINIGVWQYSTDGLNWQPVGTVSDDAALAVRASSLLRFLPTEHYNGNPTGLTVRAIDDSYTGQFSSNTNVTIIDVQSNGTPTSFSATDANVATSVTPVGDRPTATNATMSQLEDANPPAQATINSLFQGTFTDADSGQSLLAVAVSSNAADTTGQWQYSSNGSNWFDVGTVSPVNALLLGQATQLRYVPVEDHNSSTPDLEVYLIDTSASHVLTSGASRATLDISATTNDQSVSNSPYSVALDITAVNDAPEALDSTVTVTEDTPYLFATNDFGFRDTADGHNLSNVLYGTATTGTLAVESGGLTYTPAANDDGPATHSFSFSVVDDGGTVNGGTNTSTNTATMTIVMQPVNDAPTLSGSTLPAINEDTIAPGQSVNDLLSGHFHDVDTGASLHGIAISANHAPVTSGAWQYSLNGLDWTDVGTVDTSTALLVDASTLMRFQPSVHFNGSPLSLTIHAIDNSHSVVFSTDLVPRHGDITITGGATAYSAASELQTQVVSVNDSPTGAPASIDATLEDNTAGHPHSIDELFLSGFTDADGTLAGLAITGNTEVAAGQWQYTTNNTSWNNISTTSPSSALILHNTSQLRFIPSADFNGDPAPLTARLIDNTYAGPYTNDATRSIVDLSGLSDSSAFSQSDLSISTSILSVNDPPVSNGSRVEGTEDTAITLAVTDFHFEDLSDGDAFAAITIVSAPSSGMLTANGSLVATGTVISEADINDARLIYEPAANTAGNNVAGFTYRIADDGGTANGGQDTASAEATITFNLAAVNDPPAGSDAIRVILEDTPLVLSRADFGFTDPVDSNGLLAITIAQIPATGQLTLNGSPVSQNDNISADNIDDGLLLYTPPASFNGSPAPEFRFRVIDDGGTANGGLNSAASTNNLTIDILAVNDAPQGTDRVIGVTENQFVQLDLTSIGFSDPLDTGHQLKAIVIDSPPANGHLTLDDDVVSVGAIISRADILAGKLRYTPVLNESGDAYTSFRFFVQDSGGTDNGGQDTATATNTITINVRNTNAPPVAEDRIISTLEDTAIPLQVDDFGYADPIDNHLLKSVFIDALPESGTLSLNGAAVQPGDVINANEIAGHKLVFTPVASEHGDDYARIEFRVTDSGGTPNNSRDTSAPATLTIDVTAVNDPPAAVHTTETTPEDTPLILTGNSFGFSDDTDGDSLASVIIDTLPANGLLSLAATTVEPGAVVPIESINTGLLTFQPSDNASGSAYALIQFRVIDSGETVHGSNTSIEPAVLTIDVTPVDDPPHAIDLSNRTITENEVSAVAGNVSVIDHDSGDTHTVTVNDDRFEVVGDLLQLKPGLSVDFETGQTIPLVLTATDAAGLQFSQSIELAILDVNEAPSVRSTPGNQVIEDTSQPFNFSLPDRAFIDEDGDILQYTATQTDGSPLPDWITFSADTRSFTVNVTDNDRETLAIQVTANDPSGATANIQFDLEFPPTLAAAESATTTTLIFPDTSTSAVTESTEDKEQPTVAGKDDTAIDKSSSTAVDSDSTLLPDPNNQKPIDDELFSENEITEIEHKAPITVEIIPTSYLSLSKSTEEQVVSLLNDADAVRKTEQKNTEIDHAFNRLSKEMNNTQSESLRNQALSQQVVGATVTLSSGLSVGYIIWLIRGGTLMASMLTSLPAWRIIDPLPVLQSPGSSETEDTESLETMVEKTTDDDNVPTTETTAAKTADLQTGRHTNTH